MTREQRIAECRARAEKRAHARRVKAGRTSWRKRSKRAKWVSFKNLAAGRAILAAMKA